MDFNFTDGVRRTLSAARDEAIRLHHGKVWPAHIMLCLLNDSDVARELSRASVEPERLRADLLRRLPMGSSPEKLGEIPYTSAAKRVLELTMDEARRRRAPEVNTLHLLVGVFDEKKGEAAAVLREAGIVVVDGKIGYAGANTDARPSGFQLRIDDASDLSIYEQIVQQIEEGIATGALAPSERLPTVRLLADRLDIAPGTVARAYGELERRDLIITEGARGTRVADRVTQPARARHVDLATLAGLLRPAAVAAFHLGATAGELRDALDDAMSGIFEKPG